MCTVFVEKMYQVYWHWFFSLSLLFITCLVVSFQNPYDSFMRKHLQHYGYFAGEISYLLRIVKLSIIKPSFPLIDQWEAGRRYWRRYGEFENKKGRCIVLQ